MSYGFECYSDYGTRQFDETYSNYRLVLKGTAVLDTLYTEVADITDVPNPIIALRCYATDAFLYATVYQGSPDPSRKKLFLIQGASTPTGSEKISTADYYVFTSSGAPVSGHGIATYNSLGVPTFCSEWKVLRIGATPTKVPDISPTVYVPPVISVPLPYTGTWAAILSGSRVVDDYDQFSRDGINVSGITCRVGPAFRSQKDWGESWVYGKGGYVTLVDVKDY